MIRRLYIKNLAIISELTLEFEKGLNILTGETGAGKSIIIDAVSLIAAKRSSAGLVRTGEKTAVIEADFSISEKQLCTIRQILEATEIELFPGCLCIRREIASTGRSRAFINDQTISLGTLKAVSERLCELHTQGEQLSLTDPAFQMSLIDEFADCYELKNLVGDAYKEWSGIVNAWRELERKIGESTKNKDYLEFQASEIDRISPQIDEDQRLLSERKIHAHRERIIHLRSSAYDELYESENSVLTRLATVSRNLDELCSLKPDLVQVHDLFKNSVLTLTEIATSLRDDYDSTDFSPEKLADIEHRLNDLEKLKRKYGGDLREVSEVRRQIQHELDNLATQDDLRASLLAQIDSAASKYASLAFELSDLRKSAADNLSVAVTQELPGIALDHGSLKFTVLPRTTNCDDEKPGYEQQGWTSAGVDDAEVLFSANVGEDLKPLAQVASGGELSRLSLLIRDVCRRNLPRETVNESTLVFDEVDAGISGRVADIVGKKLLNLSKHQQVICVTHEAQIARYADVHFSVSKNTDRGRTSSQVAKLADESEKVKELASLIASTGETKEVQQAARTLLFSDSKKSSRSKG